MLKQKTQQQKNLEWQQLSQTTKNILENCWLSVFTNRPTSGKFEFGQRVYDGQNVLTKETLQEIWDYQRENMDFNVKVNDKYLFVQGAYREGEIDTFDGTLTEMGAKDLTKGDYLYKVTSENISFLQKIIVERETKTMIVLEDGTKIKKEELGETIICYPNKYDGYVKEYYIRETKELEKRYYRQQLLVEFELYFDEETVTNEQLIKMTDILKEGEEE